MNREHKRMIERLETSAVDLLFYLGKLPESDLFKPLAPNEWSIHQIATHLRDTEVQVFLHRTKRILEEDHPSVENFDQDAWLREHYSVDEPLRNIVADFQSARRRQVRMLQKTKDRDWVRTAQHSEYGTISLEWLVSHNVNHTFEHVAQIGNRYEKDLLKRLNK